MKYSKIEINVIHDDDLYKILKKLGIEDLNTSNILCCCCETRISYENLTGLFIKEGIVYYICDSMDCIELKKVNPNG